MGKRVNYQVSLRNHSSLYELLCCLYKANFVNDCSNRPIKLVTERLYNKNRYLYDVNIIGKSYLSSKNNSNSCVYVRLNGDDVSFLLRRTYRTNPKICRAFVTQLVNLSSRKFWPKQNIQKFTEHLLAKIVAGAIAFYGGNVMDSGLLLLPEYIIYQLDEIRIRRFTQEKDDD